MKFTISTLLLMTMIQPAFAEKMGSLDDVEYGPPEVSAAKKVEEKTRPIQLAAPLNLQPVVAPSAPAPSAGNPSAMIRMTGNSGCPNPQMTAEAAKTPLKVVVNQETQTIEISIDGKPVQLPEKENFVSTGGTLKIPNGKREQDPYCAKTPAMHKVIAMVKETDFAGTACNEDQIRSKSTVFPVYHTSAFSDENKQPIPMPKAIRIDKGIFFHEVPPSYKKFLGQDVSGECVRLHPRTAAYLYKQMEKYGAIDVTITEPRQYRPGEVLKIGDKTLKMYCDRNDIDAAILAKNSDNGSVLAKSTGSEGIVGGASNFQESIDIFGILGHNKRGIFYRDSSPQQQPGAVQPPRPTQNIGRRS